MAIIDEELGVIVTPTANPSGLSTPEAVKDLENAGKDVLNKVQETYDLVKPEVETITAGVLSSGKRLDSKPRVFSAVPNSLLVYGGLAVVFYLVFKK